MATLPSNSPASPTSAPAPVSADVAMPTELWLEQALVLVKRLWLPVAVAILAIIIVLALVQRQKDAAAARVAAAYLALSQANGNAQTNMMGMAVHDPADKAKRVTGLQAVVTEHAGTPAALEAELLLAKLAYDDKDFVTAAKRYQEFHQKHAAIRDLAAVAMLGEAHALLEQRQVAAALTAYRAVAQPALNFPAAIVSQAQLAVATCQAIEGDAAGARATLNDLVASSDDTFVKTAAQQRLRQLDLAPASFWQAVIAKPEGTTLVVPPVPTLPEDAPPAPTPAPEAAPAPAPAPAPAKP